MNKMVIGMIVVLVSLMGCNSKLKEFEKKQYAEVMAVKPMPLTAEENRRLDELSGRHLDRLDFLEDIAKREKDDAIKSGMFYKVAALNEYIKLIEADKVLYEVNKDKLG